ncbi:MAG: bifunctional riboflavin kinase/FAD synthetase [Rhodospirillales bacterium]
MRIFEDYRDIPDAFLGSAIAIGNFDGVHLGHQAVIGEAGRIARAQGDPWAVMSFEPHPRLFFKPDQPPFRITPKQAKVQAVADLGCDLMIVLPFDRALATMEAEAFVADVLVGALRVKHVACGYDFHFGKGRAGNPAMLLDAGQRLGFDFTVVNAVDDGDGHVYSSTLIREYLKAGEMRAVADLLGRPFEIAGEVVRGDQRGREWGFPTANIALDGYIEPKFGIYAVRLAVGGVGDGAPVWIDGVANLGIRPMFETREPWLEVHLFDFSGDLYGKTVRVQLLEFIRPEMKFDGLDALTAQIAEDCQTARKLLA